MLPSRPSYCSVVLGAHCIPFWHIPPVSAESAHSGGMHYFLYNPLVALAFGSLGAWTASQFATGKWTLTDPEPVMPQE